MTNYYGSETAKKLRDQKDSTYKPEERKIIGNTKLPPPLTRIFGNDVQNFPDVEQLTNSP